MKKTGSDRSAGLFVLRFLMRAKGTLPQDNSHLRQRSRLDLQILQSQYNRKSAKTKAIVLPNGYRKCYGFRSLCQYRTKTNRCPRHSVLRSFIWSYIP